MFFFAQVINAGKRGGEIFFIIGSGSKGDEGWRQTLPNLDFPFWRRFDWHQICCSRGRVGWREILGIGICGPDV